MDQSESSSSEDDEGTPQNDMKRKRIKKAVRVTDLHPDIQADIRKMINNPEYSDVVFICKDGKRVHASRLLLVARNEVLHRMLRNGMAESQCSEINLREISSTGMLIIVEFLCTGSLPEHALKEWSNAYEIINTSRFFLLEGPELVATEYLRNALMKIRWEPVPEHVANFLNAAMEFVHVPELVEKIMGKFPYELLQRSMSVKFLQVLSRNVFEYCLEVTNVRATESGPLAAVEFVRFRNIVLWCACHQFSPRRSKSSATQAITPETELVRAWLDRPLNKEELMTDKQSKLYNKISSSLAASVKPYLVHVNLKDMSSLNLVRIVEPLNIIPSSDMVDALRFRALYPDGTLLDANTGTKWSTCMDNQLYKLCKAGPRIQQKNPGNGFASYDMDVRVYNFDFEWEIIVDKVCNDFIEVGLHHYDQGYSRTGCSLSRQPGGWALRMDSSGIFINRKDAPMRKSYRKTGCNDPLYSFGPVKDYKNLVYGTDYAHRSSKIRFRINDGYLSCFFHIKDEELHEYWGKLPYSTFYPAVSLGTGSTGAVHINFLKTIQR